VFKNTLEDELGTFRSRLLYKSLLFPEQWDKTPWQNERNGSHDMDVLIRWC
jgi:hypothetical protein